MNTESNEPTVAVYTACKCGMCASGARWFMCPHISSRHVATYECARKYVDSRDIPHPDAVRVVEQAHPGCEFVYMDG